MEQIKGIVFANNGISNQGKTRSLCLLAEKIIARYPNTLQDDSRSSKVNLHDRRYIFSIDGIKVGIYTQGDPGTDLLAELHSLFKAGCSILVCATRTSGQTVSDVSKFAVEVEYEAIWCTNLRSKNKSIQNKLNDQSAEIFLTMVEHAVNILK